MTTSVEGGYRGTGEGVSIEKRVDAGTGGVTVTLAVAAVCEQSVAFRVVDPLPVACTPGDVTVDDHDRWTVDEGAIALSAIVGPDGERTASYRVEVDDPAADAFDRQPVVDVASPVSQSVADADEPPTWRGTTRAAGDVLRDGTAAPTSVVGGPDVEDVNATFIGLQEQYERCEYEEIREDVEVLWDDAIEFDQLFPASDGGTVVSPGAAPADATSTDADESDDQSDDDSATTMLSLLAAELEAGAHDDEALATVRAALGVDRIQRSEVKIRHLQSQVADLLAYVDALEEFIDGNGTAVQLLERLESETAELSTDVERVEAALTELRERNERDRERLDEVIDRMDGTEQSVHEFAADVEVAIAERDERIAALRRRSARTAERQERLVDLFDGVADELGPESER